MKWVSALIASCLGSGCADDVSEAPAGGSTGGGATVSTSSPPLSTSAADGPGTGATTSGDQTTSTGSSGSGSDSGSDTGEDPWGGGPGNPCWPDERPWRRWTDDDTPIEVTGYDCGSAAAAPNCIYEDPLMRTYAPPAVGDRVFPSADDVLSYPDAFLAVYDADAFVGAPELAGSWDDVWSSQDMYHSHIATRWIGSSDAPDERIYLDRNAQGVLMDQFIDVDIGYHIEAILLSEAQEFEFDSRMARGDNFVSASVVNMGHFLLGDGRVGFPLSDQECSYYFADTQYSAVGFFSFADVYPDRSVDSYDGLFSHMLHSVGQSNSEVAAQLKMVIAGAHLPRATKDLLKEHGIYPAAMMSIFRRSLPFADVDGNALPPTHELFHRPAYLSNGDRPVAVACALAGDCNTYRFLQTNFDYNTYREGRHLYNMVSLARELADPLPIALLDLDGLLVRQGDDVTVEETTDDERIKSAGETILRIWGGDTETLEITVDLARTFDVAERELELEAHLVYPGQEDSVEIEALDATRFRIVVDPAPDLPRGRIPVMFVARAGDTVGPPAFVNVFYPPPGYVEPSCEPNPYVDGETTPYYHPDPDDPLNGGWSYSLSADTSYRVMDNERPAIDVGGLTPDSTGTVATTAIVGEELALDVACDDPEGYPPQLYRWQGDVGSVDGDGPTWTFRYTPTVAGAADVHFICSDGTGAYNSLQLVVAASP